MGEEMPSPFIGAFQTTFSESLHLTGSPDSLETPVDVGPRQFGQFSALNGASSPRTSSTNRLDLRMEQPPQIVLHY